MATLPFHKSYPYIETMTDEPLINPILLPMMLSNLNST